MERIRDTMDLPGIARGGDFHHVKADAGICIRAVLQVVLGRQDQAALFVGVHGLACIWGAVASPGVVWQLAEAVNGLMALPNLFAIWALSPVVFRLTDEWFCQSKKEKASSRRR